MKILNRRATNEFTALVTAQALEDGGASVFQINRLPDHTYEVWAKYNPDSDLAELDKLIVQSLHNSIEDYVSQSPAGGPVRTW